MYISEDSKHISIIKKDKMSMLFKIICNNFLMTPLIMTVIAIPIAFILGNITDISIFTDTKPQVNIIPITDAKCEEPV